MTALLLSPQPAHETKEGQHVIDWQDDDYAVVVGDVRIGRIHRIQPPTGDRWMWFLYAIGAPPPLSGSTDTFEEAKAAIRAAYERACGQ
jgi:hypothetical protein